jgi:hypothetical protein
MSEKMRFAFADPPYLGCGIKHYSDHPDAADCDTPEWHAALIARLVTDYPDGWALCLSSPSLRTILPMCPPNVRVGSWRKPFASFKPNVNPAYAWEPVIWLGGRKRPRTMPTARDWEVTADDLAESITLRRGLTGAKPRAFCMWIMDLLNVQLGDTVDDLFPGSGAVGAAIAERLRAETPPLELIG